MKKKTGLIITVALIVILCGVKYVATRGRAHNEPAALILEDFDYFFREFEQTHPDPYSAFGGERRFHKQVKALRRTLSRGEGLDANRLQAEIGRFLVPLHDGHTYCGQMKYSYDSEVKNLPLNLRTMTDGFFVCSAPEEFKGLLGAGVLSIGGVPLDKLMDRLTEYVPSENVYGLYSAVSGWQMNSATLSLMLDDFDGEKVEMEFRTVSGADTTAFIPLLKASGRMAGGRRHNCGEFQQFPWQIILHWNLGVS